MEIVIIGMVVFAFLMLVVAAISSSIPNGDEDIKRYNMNKRERIKTNPSRNSGMLRSRRTSNEFGIGALFDPTDSYSSDSSSYSSDSSSYGGCDSGGYSGGFDSGGGCD